CCVNDKEVYSLEEIPKQQITSKEFDLEHKEIERKPKYIPPMSHPWKRQSFERFVRSQKHYAEGNPKTA
ncbi:MAG: transposase, partial [Clostridia bacterium]|nr:transposase [Clostridia bacterium]